MTNQGDPKVTVVTTSNAGAMRALTGAGDAEVKVPVLAAPTLVGTKGKAWLCDLDALRRRLEVRTDQDATLAYWLIEAPWAHPIWHSYALSLVHLRPIATPRKTLFYTPEATHELVLHALDSDLDREAQIAGQPGSRGWLSPTNFAAQIVEVTDALALDRVRQAAQLVCDGRLSPDSDWTRHWAALFGDNMMRDRPGARPPQERTV